MNLASSKTVKFVKLIGGPDSPISMGKRFWFVKWGSSLNRRFVKL